MIEISKAQTIAAQQLASSLDIEILLAFVLAKTRAYLYAHPEKTLTQAQFQKFQRLVEERGRGMPVAYLIGRREFWSLPLRVSKETLIPRPETELIVELTLKMMKTAVHPHILDLGTGSGAIACALATERRDWQITATDHSLGALQVAKKNRALLQLKNIRFRQSDWFSKIAAKEQFHAIVSNPPYIAAGDRHLLNADLSFEPKLALVGGESGLSAIESIIQHSLCRLKPGGLLLIEHGFSQKTDVFAMLNKYGYETIQGWQDLAGNDRVSGGRRAYK